MRLGAVIRSLRPLNVDRDHPATGADLRRDAVPRLLLRKRMHRLSSRLLEGNTLKLHTAVGKARRVDPVIKFSREIFPAFEDEQQIPLGRLVLVYGDSPSTGFDEEETMGVVTLVALVFDEQELESSAAVMGYSAVKYFDLKNNRKTDYKYHFQPPFFPSRLQPYSQYAELSIVMCLDLESNCHTDNKNVCTESPVSVKAHITPLSYVRT